MTITIATRTVDETRAVGAALADLARPGDVVLLVGDLGAGKTAFAQGYGAALGVDEPMTSPTFTLASRYQGRYELHHLDVYRLEQLDEVLELGLFDLFDEESVVLIEWGDAVAAALRADFLRVAFTFGEDDDDRLITLEPVGSRWRGRARALAEATAAWRRSAPLEEPPC
jgi:tRNA threonylcarbamoyladenosine biosynthesis protein TsaE